jgi:hypothetical protein
MRRFLRVVKDDGCPAYINFDRIERIEIRESLTQAELFLIGETEPMTVTGEHYSRLIEFLGTDQEEM